MKAAFIYQMMQTLKTEMLETEDLINLSFYEGAFYVFADQAKKANLDEEALHDYLSDFLADETRTDILEERSPAILSELKALLNGFEKAPSAIETQKGYTLISEDKLGHFERCTIEHLLMNWNEDSLPEEFSRDGIKIIVTEFGNIYLSNSANQLGTLNGYEVELETPE